MPDAAAPTDPSRRNQQAEPPADPIPIPEAEARSRKARTVRIQDILAAHARALDVRLEEGMREMRLAMEAAIRRSGIHEAPEPPQTFQPQPLPPQPQAAPPAPAAPAPAAPIREDIARGLAQQTEERFQALALRLQRIEDAVRGVGLGGGADAGEIGNKLEEITEGMSRLAASEEDLFDRFLEAQREGLEDLTRRVGAGVAGVIRALQNELSATVRRLELTSDATGAVKADDASRLERTMMAIAEHQEAVLDGRLAELRDSISSFKLPIEDDPEPPETDGMEGPSHSRVADAAAEGSPEASAWAAEPGETTGAEGALGEASSTSPEESKQNEPSRGAASTDAPEATTPGDEEEPGPESYYWY